MSVKKGSEIAVTDSFTQDVFAKLEAEFKNLKVIQESTYRTKVKMPGFSNKVEDETSIGQLISMHSAVVNRDEAYGKSQLTLGIKSAPQFKLEGFSKEDWEADIILRINIMQTKNRYDTLTELKKENEALMSNEDRKRVLAAKIAAL